MTSKPDARRSASFASESAGERASAEAALRAHARQPLAVLAVLAVICAGTLWAPPAGRTSWLLEVTPGLVLVLWLGVIYRRTPLSHWVYAGVFASDVGQALLGAQGDIWD
ncbi:MAG TPA: hypothetical protein VNW92_02680, partial [Polyangiaceae bacterium]|nr:hypothetical protein [Polyangiaceae bacterium]